MEHHIEPALLTKRVSVHMVGAGGNGAQMASRLARLDIAMRAHGHPHGMHVKAFDAALVREANIGRQVFSSADIGQPKAVVIINRINAHFGLDWDGYPRTMEDEWRRRTLTNLPDIVVSCVDTRAARRAIHHYLMHNRFRGYWLDLGNDHNSGQVILGQPGHEWRRPGPNRLRLPTVADLFPAMLDESIPDTNAPSCSIALSLASQGLYVNDTATTLAAQLLYQLFHDGKLSHHGAFFNLDGLSTVPIDVDPAMWRRLGIDVPEDADAPTEPVAQAA